MTRRTTTGSITGTAIEVLRARMNTSLIPRHRSREDLSPPGRDRTGDHRLIRPALLPLSYGREMRTVVYPRYTVNFASHGFLHCNPEGHGSTALLKGSRAKASNRILRATE